MAVIDHVGNPVAAKLSFVPRRKVRAGRLSIWVLVIVVAALVPIVASGYRLFQIELILLYMAAASGLNISVGYAGEMLLSQATVMGAAAYAGGILTLNCGWSPWESLPVAVAVAICWQLVFGIVGLRIRGLYLGLVSFFAVLVFANVVNLLSSATGGTEGLIGVPTLFSSQSPHADAKTYEVVVGILVVSVLLVAQFVSSSWGLRLRALRDCPHGLAVSGVSLTRTKLATYVVAAIPAGLAGWCLAFVNQSVSSTIFGLSLTLVLFAGVQAIEPGTVAGPLIGAGLLEGYSQLVNPFSEYNVLGLGLLLATVIVVFPNGIRRGVAVWVARARSRVKTGDAAGSESQVGLVAPLEPPVAVECVAAVPEISRQTKMPDLVRQVEALTSLTFASDQPLLQVDGLRRSFSGNLAVDGASFEVRPGSVVALMGDNGSGKTTIINVISGLLKADAGTVAVCGENATRRSAHQISALGLTRSFQIPQLIGELTVCQNVEVGLLRDGGAGFLFGLLGGFAAVRSNRRRRDEAEGICRLLGLSDAEINTTIDKLPLGLRRMTEVGRAIATGSPVVCLDEPAAGLNAKELGELGAALKALRDSNRAVLLVEHNVRFVMGLCDDIVLLRHGLVEGIFKDVRSNPLPPELEKFFGSIPLEERDE